MEGEFRERHVVVTGSSGALGAAVAQHLAERGAICHLPVRRAAGPTELPGVGRFLVGIDLTEETSVATFYAGLPELWASIHCAGGFAMAPIAETSLALWSKMGSLNASSSFLCCREAVRAIRRAGGGGRIVNVAARPALEAAAGAGMTAYAASKAALGTLTVALAHELIEERVWVNAVAPSILDTPDNRQAMPSADWSRWPKLEEVAELIAFLASPRNAATTGAIVPAYGRA